MPRRPPGAVRATYQIRRDGSSKFSQVTGLSQRTCAALQRLERRRLGPGTVAQAIATYQRFVRRPGRTLYLPFHECPCCDPVYARDILQQALSALPQASARDLRLLVARLDAEFERKTLPNPRPRSVGEKSRGWWYFRL